MSCQEDDTHTQNVRISSFSIVTLSIRVFGEGYKGVNKISRADCQLLLVALNAAQDIRRYTRKNVIHVKTIKAQGEDPQKRVLASGVMTAL